MVFMIGLSVERCYPELYKLGKNIPFSPGVSDSTIQASEVTLDLGGRIIQQSNATAGVAGLI